MFTNDTLENQAILITGGGSGLGLAIAKHLAAHGASIAVCGREQNKLDSAKKEIATQTPSATVVTYSVDVREYDAVTSMFNELDKTFKLTGLINNAAGNFFCPSEDLTPNGFKSVIDIVLHGTFNCSQAFGRQLIANKQRGSILNIETTYAEIGAAFLLPSACAKAGVHALTTTLALEWAEYGIRVNSIAPGPFPTPGAWSRLVPDPNFETTYRNRHPMKRFGEQKELADLALFLMSEHSSYINGECITIDGGERLLGGQFNFVTSQIPRAELKAMFGKMKRS